MVVKVLKEKSFLREAINEPCNIATGSSSSEAFIAQKCVSLYFIILIAIAKLFQRYRPI